MDKPVILLCGPPVYAVGGGPTHIRNMLASPLKNNFKMIHYETGSRGKESPARDENLLSKMSRILTAPLVLAWQIVRVHPTVVHINSAMNHKAFWRDSVFMCVSKLLGRKVVIQIHGGELEKLCAIPGMRHFARIVFSKADALVLLANSEKRDFSKLGFTERVYVIPNGVDVTEYCAASDRIHSGKVLRLAFMGRLIRSKGLFETMEAVKMLRADEGFRDIELSIAGSGPAESEVERWIQNNAMQKSVKLVGSIYGQEKVDFLREADVFVFPTYHREGLPYVILESLAAGTPVISSKVAGIPDVVMNRVHGILLEGKDPLQVVRAVRELARSEEELRAMSKNCRNWVSQQFGLGKLASRFGDLYERLGG